MYFFINLWSYNLAWYSIKNSVGQRGALGLGMLTSKAQNLLYKICWLHLNKICCFLLVHPSHTDESWAGRNTCMWISIWRQQYDQSVDSSSDQIKILKDQNAQTTARIVNVAYRLWLPFSINRMLNLSKLG